jgi:hypothetical protein
LFVKVFTLAGYCTADATASTVLLKPSSIHWNAPAQQPVVTFRSDYTFDEHGPNNFDVRQCTSCCSGLVTVRPKTS